MAAQEAQTQDRRSGNMRTTRGMDPFTLRGYAQVMGRSVGACRREAVACHIAHVRHSAAVLREQGLRKAAARFAEAADALDAALGARRRP